MWDLFIYLAVIIIFTVADIKSMKKAGLKKEIKIYYLLALAAGTMGILYYTEPFQDSISEMLMDLLKIHA